MGIAATERLVANGFEVLGYRRGCLDSFRTVGGTPQPGAAAVAEGADSLILLVPDEAGLAEVMSQISPSLRAGQIILCLATHPVEGKRRAAAVAESAGAVMLDGEISGTPAMLGSGQASIIIAGDKELFERMRPVLTALAPVVTHLDQFGDAIKMKLVTNFLVGVHTAATAEALQLCRRLGLDPDAVIGAIASSAGGSRMFSLRGPMMAQKRYPPGNVLALLRYFELLREGLAERGATGGPVLELTETLFRRSLELGFGALDIAAVYETFDPP